MAEMPKKVDNDEHLWMYMFKEEEILKEYCLPYHY